jgi:CRP-like cAMP-binding protein
VEKALLELKACNDFRDYPDSIQRSLCKVGWYLSLDQGRVIFRENSPASCFYFLLSGNVHMTSEREPSHALLTTGASFGDEAIIQQSNRTVTCSTDSHVELLVISKSDVLDLSLRQARISYQKSKHFAFCKSISVLRHWPIHLLEAHPEQCKVAQFKPNSVVVKDSTKNPWVYVIMTGSCRVVKRFVHGEEEEGVGHKRKSFSNPTDISKPPLLSDSAATRQPAATGTLIQRQLLLSPPRKNKHPLSQGAAQDILQRKGRPKHRLPHTISTPQMLPERQHVQPVPRKQFLVQLQLLQPKDTFGLSSFVHSDEPSVTVVSNGGEVVMLSKEFLLQHFNETMRNKLKRQITQFPSLEAMLKRIREHYSWNVYKQTTIKNSRRRV